MRLLEADPDLGSGVPEADLAQARRQILAPLVELPLGEWEASLVLERHPHAFACLVLDGLLTRDFELGERPATQLLGPGDAFNPWSLPEALLAIRVRWQAVRPTRIAVLDDQVTAAMQPWPGLAAEVFARANLVAERVARQAAIAQLPRVEDRILALLWHLAAQYGRVSVDGILVPIPLTHDALGRLTGARRPTVTLALAQLQRDAAVSRRADGSWVLIRDSAGRIEAAGAPLVRGADLTVAERRQWHAASERGADDIWSPRLERYAQLRERVAELRAGHEERVEQLTSDLARNAATRARSTELLERPRH